jgi:pimeloyl-ACP methyl ester carboxylesterase
VPSESELAASYRADETRLLAEYGLTASERMVTAPDGVELHTIDIPGDPSRPPILLLHGAASVTAAAIPLIPAFDGRRVIAPDWPGHGLSGPATFGPDDLRERAVGWLQAVVDAYGLAPPPGRGGGTPTFDLVGHSMGGQFALYYSLAHPEKVRKLILLGAPGAAFREMKAPFAFRLIALPWIGRGAFSREVTLEQYGANSALTLGKGTVDAWPPELVSVGWYASQREAFKSTLPFYYPAITGFFGTRRASTVQHDELATLRMPVLGLWGDEDVFLTPERGAPSARAIPNFEEVVLHAGHAPWLNKPEESATAVRSFLG